MSTLSYGQYYYIPQLAPGQNPGNLNLHNEYPYGSGLDASWSVILGPSQTTPAWSPIQTLPFSFNFNGNPVSQFKVSSTGVLTFTTGATTVPSASNAAIPSNSIPDNSIMAWGIQGTGTNDNIVTNTFGIAPSRQHWVFFSSYTLTSWTYWSIVFEEGTDKIYIVDQRNSTTVSGTLTLGIQINNSTAYDVAGSPAIVPLAGSGASPADNIYYEFFYGSQNTYDASTTTITMPNFALLNDPQSVTGEITNYGTATVNSMDINWQANGGTVQTQSVTGLNITTNSSYSFTHNNSWTPTATGNYTLKVWPSNINGNADQNNSNDTGYYNIDVLDNFVPKKSLYEVFTSSTCGPCVAGNQNMENLFGLDPNAGTNAGIWTMVKYQMSWPGNGDPYYTDEGGLRRTFYGINSVPRLEINGEWDSNPSGLTQGIIDSYNTPAFLEVNSTYSVTGQTVTVDATFTAVASTSGLQSSNLVYHIAILEHETVQNTGTNGETYFNFVMKKMLPNASGTSVGPFSLNTPVTINQSYTFQGSYTLPPDAGSPINHATQHSVEDFSDLQVVVWVQDVSTTEVFQSSWAAYDCGASGPTAVASGTDPTTCGASDGIAVATASGGALPYTYNWSNGATGPTITGLGAGSYTVTITDAGGCASITSVTINPVTPPTLVATGTDPTACGSNDGTTAANATGGTAPYTYNWNNGGTTSGLTGLSGGTYIVTVTDANNCLAVATVVLNDVGAPVITLTQTNLDCYGDATGTITSAVSGGQTPYTYAWSNGSTTSSVSGLTSGTYTVTITDAGGCTGSQTTTLTEPTTLTATGIVTHANCPGDSTGSINLTAAGGTAPLAYSWSMGSSSEDVSGLASGTYSVTVTDDNSCTFTTSFTVTELSAGPQTGIISGNIQVAESSVEQYSVIQTAGSTYTWFATGGNVGTGQGTNTVNIQWGAAGVGQVSVIELDSMFCEGPTVTLDVTIGTSTGISFNNTALEIDIYPNPASEFLHIEIENAAKVKEARILDAKGKSVYVQEGLEKINVAELPAGMYLLYLTTEDGRQIKRKWMKE